MIKPAQFSPLARGPGVILLRAERLWKAHQRGSQHRKPAVADSHVGSSLGEETYTSERNIVVGDLGGLHQVVSLRRLPLIVR